MDNRGDECVICLDVPPDGQSVVPLECCGQPICLPCKRRYELNDAHGAGCPCCRSTLGVVHVNIDISNMTRVILRLNGNDEIVDCSPRTMRRFVAHSRRPWHTYMTTSRSVYSENVFDVCLSMESIAAVAAFLQYEVTHNARLKKFVGDRCQTPHNSDGTSRWSYSAYWSIWPFHPDDALDGSDDMNIDPIYDPAEFTVDHVMAAAAATAGRIL
jgi:hypothetical protein